ncbi:MAG: aminoacyl-tRNA hydrolase [Bryobacteraceae bacterium]
MAEWLVVGLGNPGREYAMSPHNMGFMAVDLLAVRHGIRIARKSSRALVGSGEIAGKAVVLAKPQTYMNLSGEPVKPLLEMGAMTPANVIVVYDDHDLPWKFLRIRPRGSAGGHHGVESVIAHLGTNGFARVRLGICPGSGRATPEFLLKPFRREQKEELEGFLDQAAQAVESIISEGVVTAMTKYNSSRPRLQEEE